MTDDPTNIVSWIAKSGRFRRIPISLGKDIADATEDPLGLKFDALAADVRSQLVDSLCSLDVCGLGGIKGETPDFSVSANDHRPPSWFVRRLKLEEYHRFIQSWSERMPLQSWEAWLFVWISWTNIQGYRTRLGWRPSGDKPFSIQVTKYQHACPFSSPLTEYNPLDVIQRYPCDATGFFFSRPEVIYAFYDHFAPECKANDFVGDLHFLHWHPHLAERLIDALISASPTPETRSRVFSLFLPVANVNPALSDLLAEHLTQQERLNQWRKKTSEKKRVAKEFLEARRREIIPDLEALGPVAMLQAVIDDWPESVLFYPESWAFSWSEKLDSFPSFMLRDLLNRYESGTPCPNSWGKLRGSIRSMFRTRRCEAKKVRDHARKTRRSALIARMSGIPIIERLKRICAGKAAATYYPEQWANEAAQEVHLIPPDLRQHFLQKTQRLKKKGAWKQLRRSLEIAN